MMLYVMKMVVSAVLVVVISEVAKRSPMWGGILASLPVVSLLAIAWLYYETNDTAKVAAFARSTLWYVLPSLIFFLLLPSLLKAGRSFGTSMGIALGATAACYLLMSFILNKAGVKL
ncbi:MAG: DUF3147 family protein [Limisphaerales bacterium]